MPASGKIQQPQLQEHFGQSTSVSTNVGTVVGGASSSAAESVAKVLASGKIQQPQLQEHSSIARGAAVDTGVDQPDVVHPSHNHSDNEEERQQQETITEELTSDSIAGLKRLELSNSFLQINSVSTAPNGPTSFTQQLVENEVTSADVSPKEVRHEGLAASSEARTEVNRPVSFTQQLVENEAKVASAEVLVENEKQVGNEEDKRDSSANTSGNGTEEGGWNVTTDGAPTANSNQSAVFTENDAKALDYKMKLPLTAAMVAPVRSYLSKSKVAVMSSTMKADASPILAKLHGAIIGPLSLSPVRYDEDGDTNDAFRMVNESFMGGNHDDDEENDEQFCPFEVLYDEHNNCRKSFNMAVTQKIWENNPLMQFASGIKGVCCLKLTAGSMIWVDASFDETSLECYAAAALEASVSETTPNDKLAAYLSRMLTDFCKHYPTPVDLAYFPSIRKTTKHKRIKDLAQDQRPPFDAMVSLAVKQFSFDGVNVGDTHAALMNVLSKFQKKVSNAVRFGRLSFLGIDSKATAAVDF